MTSDEMFKDVKSAWYQAQKESLEKRQKAFQQLINRGWRWNHGDMWDHPTFKNSGRDMLFTMSDALKAEQLEELI